LLSSKLGGSRIVMLFVQLNSFSISMQFLYMT
jgi:hypothetical protein